MFGLFLVSSKYCLGNCHRHIHPLKCVGGLLGGALGRMFGGSPHFLFILYSIGQIDVQMFIVRAGCYPQLTNEHCEVLFIHKCSCVYK